MAMTVFQKSGPVRIESVFNRHSWNELITGLPDCALEQGFEWGEVLKESGCEPHRYAVFDGDECVAAIAMLRWHPPMLQSSVLYAPRGPLIASDNGPARRALGRTIKDMATATRAVFLRASSGAAACRDDVFARHRGEILGGLIGARLGCVAYFLYSAMRHGHAVDSEPRHPGSLLYWHFIKWARATGCESLRWGGSGTQLPPAPDDPGFGVYQFKRSFGSECVKYMTWNIRAQMNR